MSRGLRASTVAIGIFFGFLITVSGFGNYRTIHQALLFHSPYLYGVFGSAVVVAAAGLALLRRAGATAFGGPLRLPHHRVRPRHLYGAALFGVGFGLAGTCPGGAVAMVATGGLGGLLVLAGLVTGLWLRGVTERASRPQHPGPLPSAVSAEPGPRAAIARHVAGPRPRHPDDTRVFSATGHERLRSVV